MFLISVTRLIVIPALLISVLPSDVSAGENRRPIRFNVDALPITLEPPLITDSTASWLLTYVADRLVETPVADQIYGNLAESWEILDDRKLYQFQLSKKRKFSDGTPLNASAVENSFKLAMSHQSPTRSAYFFHNIVSVKAVGQFTVEIRLKRPDHNFLTVLSDECFSIYKQCGTEFCYTGDFRVGKRTDQSIEIVRALDEQIFEFQRLTFEEAYNRFKAGDLEVLKSYGLPHLKSVKESSTRKIIARYERSYFVSFNSGSGLFRDLAMRRRMARAIDHAKVDEALKEQNCVRATSMLTPTLSMSRQELRHHFSELDSFSRVRMARKARILVLKEHEISDLALSLFSRMDPAPEVVALNKPEFLSAFKQGAYDVIVIGYGLKARNWEQLSAIFYSKGRHNFARINDSQVDKILLEGQAEPKPQQQMKILSKLLQLNEQNFWYVPITHAPLYYAFQKSLSISPDAGVDRIDVPSSDIDLKSVTWIQRTEGVR